MLAKHYDTEELNSKVSFWLIKHQVSQVQGEDNSEIEQMNEESDFLDADCLRLEEEVSDNI